MLDLSYANVSTNHAWLWRNGPPLTGIFAIAGIVLCNRLTMVYETLPPWMVTPAISFTGILPPTRWLYLACFGSVAVAFSLMAWPMYDYARNRVTTTVKRTTHAAFVLAFVAFWGLFLQAACPLQADLIHQMAQLTDAHSAQVMRESLTLQTWLHQLGAVAFFLCSVLHGFCILYIYGRPDNGLHSIHGWHFWLKLVFLVMAVVPLVLGFVWHPGAGSTTPRHDRINFGGLMQWLAVGTLISFWVTYTFDFASILQHEKARKK